MKRSKWLGFILAVAIGFLLFKLWSLIAGVLATVVLLVVFVVLAGSGLIWGSDDEDEDQDGDDEDDDDEQEEDD